MLTNERSIKLYGIDVKTLEENYKVVSLNGQLFVVTSFFKSRPDEYAGMILSDVQELLSLGKIEEANHLINRAKYVLFQSNKLNREAATNWSDHIKKEG